MKSCVCHASEVPFSPIDGGAERRILSHTEDMMVVEIHFPAGGVGAVHTHPHAQSCYIRSGAFRFTIDGVPFDVSAGDSITFERGIPHGTLCLEAGVLIDVFTPRREDFL